MVCATTVVRVVVGGCCSAVPWVARTGGPGTPTLICCKELLVWSVAFGCDFELWPALKVLLAGEAELSSVDGAELAPAEVVLGGVELAGPLATDELDDAEELESPRADGELAEGAPGLVAAAEESES